MPLSLPNPISFEGLVVAGTALSSRTPRGTEPNRQMSSAIVPVAHRMEIHDLSRYEQDEDTDLPKYLEVHYNPKEVKETIKVIWTEIAIPGMSHKRLHYHLTENVPFKFDLTFDTMQMVGGSPRGADGKLGTEQAKRFIKSLCYAQANAQSTVDGAPPRVLFYWPNFLSLTCVVEQEDWTHQMFHADGTPRRSVCSMTLKEIRSTRLTSSDVLRGGDKRNSPFPPQGKNEHIIKVG